jgi:NAD(P)-dependent dehydrogenase (short-subunit alcohol dehydrogenase family)
MSPSGATKGIGRAITLDLATRGASLLGTYSSPESAKLFESLSHSISSLYSSSTNTHAASLEQPKLVGIEANISSPSAPAAILDALRKHFDGKIDIVVFNAAVMGLARFGEGNVTKDFVSTALAGNVEFPIMLMEELVSNKCLRRSSRVIAVSSEGVRARRPAGG